MAINRQLDINGEIRSGLGISGEIRNGTSIRGNVSVRQKVYKELYFATRDTFPEEGSSDVLYIDTSSESLWFWMTDHYVAMEGVSINDAEILSDATWSSIKISNEIDVARVTPLTNAEILNILSK